MPRSTLRKAVIVFTVITAIVHLVVLNISIYQDKGSLDVLFTLNGLGYFTLLWAYLNPPAFLKGKDVLFYYAYIAYTIVTILAWIIINPDVSDPVGVITKLDEVLLTATLLLHLE